MPVPVLVTRPEPGASATAARLISRGFRPVLAPLLRVETFARSLPAIESLRGILIASQQAIPALPALYHHLPLYAVGDATAVAARAQGFTQVVSAGGKAEDLAALIIRELPKDGPPFLLATGLNQGDRLKTILQAFGFEVIKEEVYVARSVTHLPAEVMRPAGSCSFPGRPHFASIGSAKPRAFRRAFPGFGLPPSVKRLRTQSGTCPGRISMWQWNPMRKRYWPF
jgi:uroporphyrinogen-III synthase